MPEGDTIFRAARALHRVLEGATIERVRGRDASFDGLRGQRVERVYARSKHLLMDFGERLVHSHMGMHGSWRIHRPHELAAQAERFARAELELHTAQISVCCSQPATLELLRADQLRAHPQLSRLGPDLLDEDFDGDEALRRLLADPACPLGVVMMDQRRLAGIGNVYKSELAFMQRLDPFSPISSFDEASLRALLIAARECLQDNVRRVRRVTRFVGSRPAGLWVYERSGRPCHVCRGPIRMRRQSTLGRSTYFCPRCQKTTPTSTTGS